MSDTLESLSLWKYEDQLNPLPDPYRRLEPAELEERSRIAKKQLKDELLILGHNYQQEAVIQFADATGDSFTLSKIAAERSDVPYIVFCGVTFMAETADILTAADQAVLLPSMEASCPMAGMAEMIQVDQAWKRLSEIVDPDDVIPVTYINSYADLKAFTAEQGGAVCTSSNAAAVFQWALDQGKKVFVLPDEHLGRNTAYDLGYEETDMVVWNPWDQGYGGLDASAVRDATFILWKGYCQVHGRFTYDNVVQTRKQYPEAEIIVHPECRREVVQAADYVGSTSSIIRTVSQAPAGTTWAIGTEIHLVQRLQQQETAKTVLPLGGVQCMDCNAMRQIEPEYLLWILESLVDGQAENRIQVPEAQASLALEALDRMLTIG